MAESSLIRVGTAGWSYDDWNGIVYPTRPAARFDQLAFIASLFDTNEINSSFYRIPSPRTTRDWARRVAHNPRFAFTAKLYRGFTHEREAGAPEEKEFLAALEPLRAEERLGSVLAQFPVSFRNTAENRHTLEELLGRFPGLPLAVEFRHGSWDREDTLDALAERGAAFVNIDQPYLGGNLHATQHVTAPIAYYRFHGRNAEKWFGPDTSNEQRYNYLYSVKELDPWAKRIRESSGKAPGGVFAILNNHFRGQAVANAVQLQNLLTGETPAAPETLTQTYPVLASTTVPSAGPKQRKLF